MHLILHFNFWYVGGEPLPGQKIKPKFTSYPKSDATGSSPAWIAFDKQVNLFSVLL